MKQGSDKQIVVKESIGRGFMESNEWMMIGA